MTDIHILFSFASDLKPVSALLPRRCYCTISRNNVASIVWLQIIGNETSVPVDTMGADSFGAIMGVIGVSMIAKACAAVAAGISAMVMWNGRNSMVFYGEDNFCDDSQPQKQGYRTEPYIYSTCFGNIHSVFSSLVFISQVVALFSGNK